MYHNKRQMSGALKVRSKILKNGNTQIKFLKTVFTFCRVFFLTVLEVTLYLLFMADEQDQVAIFS